MEERKTVPFLVKWNNAEGGYSEGPLSLLWSLIESYKVDIFDVSLSRITRDFLGFMKLSNHLSLELGTEFTLMASNLLYLKSKALLPDPGYEEDEPEPALPKELVEKLLEYKKFQLAGKKLSLLEKFSSAMMRRESNQVLSFGTEEETWLDLNLIDLISAFNGILQKSAVNIEEPELLIAEQELSVSDKMDYIISSLENSGGEIYFSEVFYSAEPENMDIVISFMAILELVKQKITRVMQNVMFGDIKLFLVR